MALTFIDRPTPNVDARRTVPDMIILHYTGMKSGEAAIERLCDPASRVSAHYVVEEDGRIFRLAPEERRCWHAGISHWRGEDQLNHASIGIEIVNPGHEWGYRAFPKRQIDALIVLCRGILALDGLIMEQQHMRLEADEQFFEVQLESLHHRDDHDQNANPKQDAEHGDDRDDREEGALRLQVAKAEEKRCVVQHGERERRATLPHRAALENPNFSVLPPPKKIPPRPCATARHE